ncbi:LapA family protein [Providencia burhodogranariea]|uniref:Lipopolysaccharide assembly protein A n=1 Tax=Providencia burhodogranariea DSM 19968 TaxID=1141662 RepID=K8WT36_9GAMM|nr:lipopolysaccharide assembly protein LapA domain-containing protein [Providencia burhodogranariea]EKT63738.1 inner membrane protein YciS [Providencia burhodogranariea DSM 19968]
MKYFLILLLAVVIFIISITLGSSNNQVITFNYLIAQGDFSVSSLLASLFGVGFVLGWLVAGVFYLRAMISLKNARRKIKRLESQLSASDKTIPESSELVTAKSKE